MLLFDEQEYLCLVCILFWNATTLIIQTIFKQLNNEFGINGFAFQTCLTVVLCYIYRKSNFIAIFQHAKSRIIYCNQIVWFSDIHRHGGLCLGNYFFFVLLYSSWHKNMSTATSFHINLTDLKSYWTSKMSMWNAVSLRKFKKHFRMFWIQICYISMW